jgi:hypothetical protein
MFFVNGLPVILKNLISYFLLFPLALELYSRIPLRCNNLGLPVLPALRPLPDALSNKKEVTILFHGFGGQDLNTDRIIDEINKACDNNGIAHCYDWELWRGNLFRAANNGLSIGKKVGKELAGNQNIEKLHVIGISVGSFAANACLDSFISEIDTQKRKGQRFNSMLQPPDSKVQTHITFLDPFTQRGIFGAKYGIKNFGKNAEFAEQYLNTDDPVPSTNEPIDFCHVYDITQHQQRKNFVPLPQDNMHSWPAAFYGLNYRSVLNIGQQVHLSSHKTLPRGKTTRL